MTDTHIDNLTDVELRQELQKYGLPLMPVTETTRNLLIKKLKSYVLNDTSSLKSPASNRRSLQSPRNVSKRQTSSVIGRTNISPSRRRTNAATPSAIKYTNNHDSRNNQDNATVAVSGNTSSEYYLSNEGRSYLNRDYENYANNRTVTTHSTLGGAGYSFFSPNSKYINNNPKSSPKIYVPPPILSNDMHHFNSSRLDTPHLSRENDRPPLRNGKESPGVVSRLLKLRDITIGRSHVNSSYPTLPSKQFYISDSDSDNSSFTRYSSSLNRRQNRSIGDNLWYRLNIKNKFKQSSVPYLLISCLGLFFLLLAVLYMTKPPDMPSTMLEKSTAFTLCEEFSGHMPSIAKPSINCIDKELLSPSLALNKELIQLLQANIEAHYCRDRLVSSEITGTEFMKYLYKKRTIDAHKLLKSFHGALYLIENNPQWKIQILNKLEGQQNLPDIYKQDIKFGLLKPYLPLKCILFNKIQRFFVIIGSVFLIALLMGFMFIMWRFLKQRKLLRLKTVDNFIKEIIKELMYRASHKGDGQDEVIINHLRDKLVPLNKRKSVLWAWNEALQKLEGNDSRIQFGYILKNGEEFRTMRWVESTLPTSNPLNSPFSPTSITHQDITDQHVKKKQWQSPAFDNVNKISEPPTPCLKIRHMFDASEANLPDIKHNIIESILEKVGQQCRIFDIQLDRQSCCVYIRCATEKDAGIIHNEINGWWYDNRLVSIKFLRLQRYLARFPNSSGIGPIAIKNSK